MNLMSFKYSVLPKNYSCSKATIAEWSLHDPVRNEMVCYPSSESGEQNTQKIYNI